MTEDKKSCFACGEGRAMWRVTLAHTIVLLGLLLSLFLIVKIFSDLKAYGSIGTDPSNPNTIVVSGKGEIYAKPDMATVSFSVTSENLDVGKASNAVNTKIAAVLAKLAADGVASADIQTTDYSITPQYNYNYLTPNSNVYQPVGSQTLAGYQVSQSITLKIRDLTKAGSIVSDLAALSVTGMSGLSFTNSNEDALTKQARDEAITDARSQAQALAKSLGVALGSVVSFSENGGPVYYANMAMSAMPMASGAVQASLPAGQNDITSNVSITYEIR